MITISESYDLVWQFKPSNNYKFTKDGRCFNTRRNKELKRTLVGGSVGFCLNGGFKSLTKIREELELIETNKTKYPYALKVLGGYEQQKLQNHLK